MTDRTKAPHEPQDIVFVNANRFARMVEAARACVRDARCAHGSNTYHVEKDQLDELRDALPVAKTSEAD